jgi:hypothetical protein
MSQMKNQAVLVCPRCRSAFILAELRTVNEDPDLKILHSLMKDIAKNMICPDCLGKLTFEANKPKGVLTDYHVRPQIITPTFNPTYYRDAVKARNERLRR